MLGSWTTAVRLMIRLPFDTSRLAGGSVDRLVQQIPQHCCETVGRASWRSQTKPYSASCRRRIMKFR
jgi:hypothetical protein